MVQYNQPSRDTRDHDATRVNGRFTPSPSLKKERGVGGGQRRVTTGTTSTIGTRSGGVEKPNREKATKWLRLCPAVRANNLELHSLRVPIPRANGRVRRHSQPIVRGTAILSHGDESPEFLLLGILQGRQVLVLASVVIVRGRERVLGHWARSSSVRMCDRLGMYSGCLEVLMCSSM